MYSQIFVKMCIEHLLFRKGEVMRRMEFKMERPGLVKEGDVVEVTEGRLPMAWYYMVEPAVAMSGNIPLNEQLKSKNGTVVELEKKPRGYYIVVEFDE